MKQINQSYYCDLCWIEHFFRNSWASVKDANNTTDTTSTAHTQVRVVGRCARFQAWSMGIDNFRDLHISPSSKKNREQK